MLHISKELLDLIARHAESQTDECCGFLFGHDTGEERRVVDFMAAENTSGARDLHYSIAAVDYLHAERHAEKQNTTLLGIYHSHPGYPPFPSIEDISRAQPLFSYLILSTFRGKLREFKSWRLSGPVEEEEIELI
jgi:proteasome lid subunit RPN8/RPN11